MNVVKCQKYKRVEGIDQEATWFFFSFPEVSFSPIKLTVTVTQ
jgi:hypothetical protein